MPYNLYAYDSYGTQTGSDYSNDSFSSYKGYDKGPFGYKTGVRQYDPETGRFLSPDAFKGFMDDPSSQHPYVYCQGNPIRYSDPSGYAIVIDDIAIGGAIAAGATAGYTLFQSTPLGKRSIRNVARMMKGANDYGVSGIRAYGETWTIAERQLAHDTSRFLVRPIV